MSLILIRKQEPLGDVFNFGKPMACPCCGQAPLVRSVKPFDYAKRHAKSITCKEVGIRYVSKRRLSLFENGYFLVVDHSCPFCGKVKDYFASFSKNELIAVWNSIVNAVLLIDDLRILEKYPPDVRYRTVIDLIPTLSDDERELVRRFMNEYYPSPAKTNCSVDELLRGEVNE